MKNEKRIKITEDQQRVLEKSRALAEEIFALLSSKIKDVKDNEELEEVSNILNKTTAVLHKTIKQEQELLKVDFTKDADGYGLDDSNEVTPQDLEMLEEFLERCKNGTVV